MAFSRIPQMQSYTRLINVYYVETNRNVQKKEL